MDNTNNTDIIKNENSQIERLSQQLKISNKIIAQSDKYFKKITDEFTIRKAIKLARYSRFTVDGFYNPNEFDGFDEDNIYSEILEKLNSFNSNFSPYTLFYLPKKAGMKRTAYYIPFVEYCIRFIIGIVVYDEYKNDFLDNIYGGKDDVFKFNKNNSFKNFSNWQFTTAYSYNFLYSVDIKSFFDTINQDLLLDSIRSKLTLNKTDYFYKVLKCAIKFDFSQVVLEKSQISESLSGLIVGSRVDGFFQNIVLSTIDNKLKNLPNIAYGRFTDDIKIFCYNNVDGENVLQILQIELEKLGLNLNLSKSQIQDLKKHEIQLKNHYTTKICVM